MNSDDHKTHVKLHAVAIGRRYGKSTMHNVKELERLIKEIQLKFEAEKKPKYKDFLEKLHLLETNERELE